MNVKPLNIPLTVYNVTGIMCFLNNGSQCERFSHIFECRLVTLLSKVDKSLDTNQIIIPNNADESFRNIKMDIITEVELVLPNSPERHKIQNGNRFFLVFTGKKDDKFTFDLLIYNSNFYLINIISLMMQ